MKMHFLRTCLVALSANLLVADVPAQDSSEVWVKDIRAPQYIGVWVKDVDRSVKWYRTVFGLKPVGGSRADDGSWRIENLRSDDLFCGDCA